MANISAAMTALGDPTRQAIFERLKAGPCPVGVLAEELPVTTLGGLATWARGG